jgi:lipoxygenase
MIRLKQPLLFTPQRGSVTSPLFAAAAAATGQQRRASRAGGRVRTRRIRCASTEEAVGVTTSVETKERHLTVTAIVTAQAVRTSMYISRGLDDLQDLFGKTLLLELVSSELDPSEFLSLNSRSSVAGELCICTVLDFVLHE